MGGIRNVNAEGKMLDHHKARAAHYADPHERVRYHLETRVPPPRALKAEVESQITTLLPTQRCTLEQVALALNMHPRTLQRRLANETIDFEACLDRIRRRLAEHMLRSTRLSVTRISSELGYRRATSFCRAHLRWFNMTPLEHRRQFGGQVVRGMHEQSRLAEPHPRTARKHHGNF